MSKYYSIPIKLISIITLAVFIVTQCGLGYAYSGHARISKSTLRQMQREEFIVLATKQRPDEAEAGASGGIVGALIQAGKKLVQPFMNTGIKRILLVEDNRDTLDLMERMVKAWNPKVYVAKAMDRDAALRLFRDEGPIDAVITDYMLGKDGGYGDEVVKAINPPTREKTIPVLILSDGARYQLEPRLAPLKSSGQLIDYRGEKTDIVNNFERFKTLFDELDKAVSESKAVGGAPAAGQVPKPNSTSEVEMGANKKVPGAFLGIPFDPENAIDKQPDQVAIVKSGEPLEFGEGYLYCGRDGLDSAIFRNSVSGELLLTRIGHQYAAQSFTPNAQSPAILVLSSNKFNLMMQQGMASINYVGDRVKGFVDPYPKIIGDVHLDEFEEIWVDEETYGRYTEIINRDDSTWDPITKARLQELMQLGKIKVIAGFNRMKIGENEPYEYVGQYMLDRGFFDHIPGFRISKNSSAPTAGQEQAENGDNSQSHPSPSDMASDKLDRRRFLGLAFRALAAVGLKRAMPDKPAPIVKTDVVAPAADLEWQRAVSAVREACRIRQEITASLEEFKCRIQLPKRLFWELREFLLDTDKGWDFNADERARYLNITEALLKRGDIDLAAWDPDAAWEIMKKGIDPGKITPNDLTAIKDEQNYRQLLDAFAERPRWTKLRDDKIAPVNYAGDKIMNREGPMMIPKMARIPLSAGSKNAPGAFLGTKDEPAQAEAKGGEDRAAPNGPSLNMPRFIDPRQAIRFILKMQISPELREYLEGYLSYFDEHESAGYYYKSENQIASIFDTSTLSREDEEMLNMYLAQWIAVIEEFKGYLIKNNLVMPTYQIYIEVLEQLLLHFGSLQNIKGKRIIELGVGTSIGLLKFLESKGAWARGYDVSAAETDLVKQADVFKVFKGNGEFFAQPVDAVYSVESLTAPFIEETSGHTYDGVARRKAITGLLDDLRPILADDGVMILHMTELDLPLAALGFEPTMASLADNLAPEAKRFLTVRKISTPGVEKVPHKKGSGTFLYTDVELLQAVREKFPMLAAAVIDSDDGNRARIENNLKTYWAFDKVLAVEKVTDLEAMLKTDEYKDVKLILVIDNNKDDLSGLVISTYGFLPITIPAEKDPTEAIKEFLNSV